MAKKMVFWVGWCACLITHLRYNAPVKNVDELLAADAYVISV